MSKKKLLFKVIKIDKYSWCQSDVGYFWAYSVQEVHEYLRKHDIHYSGVELVVPFDIYEEVI